MRAEVKPNRPSTQRLPRQAPTNVEEFTFRVHCATHVRLVNTEIKIFKTKKNPMAVRPAIDRVRAQNLDSTFLIPRRWHLRMKRHATRTRNFCHYTILLQNVTVLLSEV